jgi:hypothetical protein
MDISVRQIEGTPHAEAAGMAKNIRTVAPKSGGTGWQVTGGDAAFDVASRQQGVERATQELLRSGGGKLVIKGHDGKVHEQNTIGQPTSASHKRKPP